MLLTTLTFDKAIFTIHGEQLRVDVTVPANIFRPYSTKVPFSINAPNVSLSLTLPRWNTHALGSTTSFDKVLWVQTLCIDTTYNYFSEVREECVDSLIMSIRVAICRFLRRKSSDSYSVFCADFQTFGLGDTTSHGSARKLFWDFYSFLYDARISQ